MTILYCDLLSRSYKNTCLFADHVSFMWWARKQCMAFRNCVHCNSEYESLYGISTCSSQCAKEIGK